MSRIAPRHHRELTVADLIALLEDYPPDAVVRLAEQPHWPFEYSLRGLVRADDVRDPAAEEVEPAELAGAGRVPGPVEEPEVVYLVEGSQLGYLCSKDVFDAAQR